MRWNQQQLQIEVARGEALKKANDGKSKDQGKKFGGKKRDQKHN